MRKPTTSSIVRTLPPSLATWPAKKMATVGMLATSLALALMLAAPGTGAAESKAAANAKAPVVVVRQSFADLVERVQPAVVNVSTKSRVSQAAAQGMPFQFPPGSPQEKQFREFFEKRFGGKKGENAPRASGVGSGFIVDAQGHIVTNNHVIKGADEIIITLNDGTELQAEVVGHDNKTDLALLKVDSKGDLPFVTFGDSDGARVGDWVIAVGSPFGLGGTVTAGILSARGRDIHAGPFDDYLQVDAPINKGNSGGPLFDQTGQVIGVNTAIFSPTGGSVGIGFAIPSELAAQVVESLKTDGHVKRGWMGVNIQTLSAELAQSFGLDEPTGALVAGVLEDSPAQKAGVKVGDIIVNFDGQEIDTMRDLPKAVAATKAGRDVTVKVLREGKSVSLTLNVGNMPGSEKLANSQVDEPEDSSLGFTLSALDDETRSNLGLKDGSAGVLITEVASGSPAALQGLRPGDVILRVGSGEVRSPKQVQEAMSKASAAKHERILMLISRDGNERFVTVPFEQG